MANKEPIDRVNRSILSLDVGTSSCKAILFNEAGIALASGSGQYPVYYSEDQVHAEQDPDDIWEGVCAAIGEVLDNKPASTEISAIALCSQVSSHMLVDRENRAITRILTWADSRANEQAQRVKAAFSRDELIRCLGADMPSGPYWPLPKLMWWNENHPEYIAKAKYVVQPKEWVLWKLTGEWMSDLSSLKGLVHQSTRQPAHVLLEWAGILSDLIPPIGEPFQLCGRLLPILERELGLQGSIPVVLGWNDLHAAILGACRWTKSGIGFDITGTSEQIGQCVHADQLNARSYEGVNRIPFLNRYHTLYGVTSSGGQAFKWYAEHIDQYAFGERKGPVDYELVSRQAALAPAGAAGLIFLPFLNGERYPWRNPDARGVFYGLNFSHGRPHMARAVMEGVGYALRSIEACLPLPLEAIVIAGGASRSDEWNQMKADILGIPVYRTQEREAGCLGAAMLAAAALGWYTSLEEASTRMVRVEREYVPDASARSVYDESYGHYLELYRSLGPLFKKTAAKTR